MITGNNPEPVLRILRQQGLRKQGRVAPRAYVRN